MFYCRIGFFGFSNLRMLWKEHLYFPTVGFMCGFNVSLEQEVIIDHKGRVLIPKEIRDKAGLKPGGKARLKIEKENIVISAPVSPDEFIKEMEGCITESTPTIDPLDLKKMWEQKQRIEKTK